MLWIQIRRPQRRVRPQAAVLQSFQSCSPAVLQSFQSCSPAFCTYTYEVCILWGAQPAKIYPPRTWVNVSRGPFEVPWRLLWRFRDPSELQFDASQPPNWLQLVLFAPKSVPRCPPSSFFHEFLIPGTLDFAIPYNEFDGFSTFQQVASKTLSGHLLTPKNLPKPSQGTLKTL